MDIALQDIERQANEQMLLAAEVLLDTEAVGQLQEIARNFWIAFVRDAGRNLEVELKITAGKLRQATCECPDFLQKGSCPHILATALVLRKKLAQEVAPPAPVKPRKATPEKLTTSLVLEEIDPKALYDFLRLYARKNRKFELALTTHFASSISSIDSGEKYINLIEATLKTAMKPDRSLGTRGAVILEKLFQDLIHQAKNTLAIRDFNETWSILQSLILKSAPLLGKVEEQSALFEQTLAAFSLVGELLNKDIAPALKEDIWKFCTEESAKLVYRKHSLDIGLFQILRQLCDEQDKKHLLVDLLLKQLQVYEKEELSIHPLVFQYLQVADVPMRAPLLRHYYEQLPDLLTAIEISILAELPKVGEILLDFAKQQSFGAAHVKELDDLQLQLAHSLGDIWLEIELLSRQLTRYFDLDCYKKIKKLDPQGLYWQADASIALLQAAAQTPEHWDCIAGILGEEQEPDLLIDWIRKHASLDLLLNHDHYLLPVHHTAVLELYDTLLTSFLDTHIGPIPAQKIGRIIRHLKALDADQLVAYLVEQFRKKYPNRHTLMEELSLYDGYED